MAQKITQKTLVIKISFATFTDIYRVSVIYVVLCRLEVKYMKYHASELQIKFRTHDPATTGSYSHSSLIFDVVVVVVVVQSKLSLPPLS